LTKTSKDGIVTQWELHTIRVREARVGPGAERDELKVTNSVGIIADDYTGALMVACYLEAAGIYAPLVFHPDAEVAESSVVVAGTRARTIEAATAVSNVVEFLDGSAMGGSSRFVYKPSASFDSTPSGNIGPVADCLAQRTGWAPTFMAAGFPEVAITTHLGYLFYRGKIVTASIKRFDPLTPMPDPDLVRFLSQQTDRGVELVSHLDMCRGRRFVENKISALSSKGAGHIFFDVSDEADLRLVADLAARSKSVFIASDPVAVAFAKNIVGNSAIARAAPRHVSGPAAVLVGTVAPVIQRQLAAFSEVHPVLALDLTQSKNPEAIASDAMEWAAEHVGSRPFAIATSRDQSDVERAHAAYGSIGAARRAEEVLGILAREFRARGIKRFLVAGGETSGSVVSALGIKAVRGFPEGPLGTGFCVTTGEDPISLFLKPGKFGSDDVLLEALDHMR